MTLGASPPMNAAAMVTPRVAARGDADARAARARPLRLLLLTDELEVGGTQRQLVQLATGLDRRRFEVSVLFFRNPSPLVAELRRGGVTVVHLPKQGAVDLSFLRRLRAVLADGRYDLMHCFAFSGELWGTLARALLPAPRRPRLLTSVRGTYAWYRPWQWRVKRWVTLQSEAVVANSRAGAELAAQCTGLPTARFTVVPNGVSVPQEVAPAPRTGDPLRQSLLDGADGPLLLFVGRLVEIKDLPTLLKAMHRLRELAPQVRLAIAGSGPLRESLERRVQDERLGDRVRLLGERDDVPALIAAADVIVLPSRREGLSNVLLEAMAGSRPVVATRAGGTVELVEDGHDGLLFDVGDDAALADHLLQLAHDAPLRERLGHAGRLHAESGHGLDAMVQAYATIYDRPASRARHRAEPGGPGE